jgi:hypothetical protein
MKKLLSTLSLAAIATTALASPAFAEPYTIHGQKGNYTINHNTGTYRGCLFSGGCVTLGRKYLVPCVESNGSDACDVRSWKKGEYTYQVYIDENVTVYKNGQTIFQDAAKR